MHKRFQVDAGNVEMAADVRDLGGVRFEHERLATMLPTFFGDDRRVVGPSAGNHEGIGDRRSLEALLRADQALEMLDLENLSDELKLGTDRCGEQGRMGLGPLHDFFANRLPFEFVEHLTRGYQVALIDERV